MKSLFTFTLIIILLSFCVVAFANEYETVEVAKTIAMEACGEGYGGMYAVANVIANRSKKYNKSPYEIVSHKNQFYGFTNPNRDKRFKECKKDSLHLAKELLNLKDITHGALYFKRPEEKRQAWHKVKTITINHHEFWR